MQCPKCRSHNVYRSRRQDRPLYRFLCVAKFRCHCCAHLFMRPILMHAVKYLLSERYREFVYWSDLGSGSHSRRSTIPTQTGTPHLSRMNSRDRLWEAYDVRR